MLVEIISAKRGTQLRKNTSYELKLSINQKILSNIFIINGPNFIIEPIKQSDLIVKPYDHYMIINNNEQAIKIAYNLDISNHEIVYDPYKYEHSQKVKLKAEQFLDKYNVPPRYIDTLPKWYSFKFTYPDFNLIFIKPEMGLSIQIHAYRSENWEILGGNPIILSSNKVYYNVKDRSTFNNQKNTYHSVINPNKNKEKFVVVKEYWKGFFDEEDIIRAFNPNNYP
jgi:hypothetical protein